MLNHRPENHKIELLKDKQTSFVWNYKPLSKQETEAMKKYIDEHLEKSFIKSSSPAAAAASVLLVRKPSSRLRFYVDYRAFNKITMKNWYLILLIDKTLGKLSSTARFI